MPKLSRALRAELTRLGFVWTRRSGHEVWHHRQHGKMLSVSTTPSDWRNLANLRARARRLARGPVAS